jgi:hypothetical protein
MRQRSLWSWARATSGIAALVAAGWILGRGDALAKHAYRPSVKGQLSSTTAGPAAEGTYEEDVQEGSQDGSAGVEGYLKVRVRKLAPKSKYRVNVGGTPIGELKTNGAGTGRATFSSNPRRAAQPLAVDPRGKSLSVTNDADEAVLEGEVPDPTTPGGIQCCLNTHDASGDQQGCDSLLPADCAAAGGVDMGPGTCEPDPCPDTGPDDDAQEGGGGGGAEDNSTSDSGDGH